MSDLSIFKGNNLVNEDLFKSLMDMNKTMSGGTGAIGKRISIRGGKFRMMVDGEQVAVKREATLNLVIVNSATVSRTYYEGNYDPDNPTAPTCWSKDTRKPAEEVPDDQRQASSCASCPMNIKGSGQGESRACRFSQRLAVVLEGDLETVYQFQIPAASIFGEARGNDMGLQAYVKFLSAHNTPVIGVVTEVRFDDDSDAPKLFFKPVRGLGEEELRTVLEARESEDALRAIELTVSQTDKVSPEKTEKVEKPKTTRSTKAKKQEVDEGDEEPTKVEKPKAQKTLEKETKSDKLASILEGWDD